MFWGGIYLLFKCFLDIFFKYLCICCEVALGCIDLGSFSKSAHLPAVPPVSLVEGVVRTRLINQVRTIVSGVIL